MELYDRGHELSPYELSGRLQYIVTNAHRMVERRRQAMNIPPHMINIPNEPPLPMVEPDMMDIVNQGIQAPQPRSVPIRQFFGNRPLTPPSPPPAQLRPRATLTVKRKVISVANLTANCADSCAICMDIHKKGDSLTTCCGHEFGKECYQNWFNSPTSNQKCPTCRATNPSVTVYIRRVYRAPAAHNVV